MKSLDFNYHLENLKASDPDYVVDALGITTQELLDAFPEKAEEFINKEFG